MARRHVSPRQCQKKGKAFQRRIAQALQAATRLGEGDFTSNHGGVDGEEDVIRSAAARERFPLRIECKNTQTISILQWIRELDADRARAGDPHHGVIIYKPAGTRRVRVDLDLYALIDQMYGPLPAELDHELRRLLAPAAPVPTGRPPASRVPAQRGGPRRHRV